MNQLPQAFAFVEHTFLVRNPTGSTPVTLRIPLFSYFSPHRRVKRQDTRKGKTRRDKFNRMLKRERNKQ